MPRRSFSLLHYAARLTLVARQNVQLHRLALYLSAIVVIGAAAWLVRPASQSPSITTDSEPESASVQARPPQVVPPPADPAAEPAPEPAETAAASSAEESLPRWVLVNQPATFWSGPDEAAIAFTDLPQWSYLEVRGPAQTGRLFAYYPGDYGTRHAGLGWVDEAVAGPADDPGQWLRTHPSAALWSGPDDGAIKFTDLPQGSWLHVVDDASLDGHRVLVYYYGDGIVGQPGHGWVDAADVGRVAPPAPGELPSPPEHPTLPEWVQVHHLVPLWSSPDQNAAAFTELPQWSYLQLQDLALNGRLLAYYAGDYATRQPGVGWVDEAAVGPAGYAGFWLRNHRASTLWSGPDGAAERFGDLPRGSYLRILEGTADDLDRVFVFYHGDGRTRHPGPAWVPRADVEPVTPPAPLPEPQRPGSWVSSRTIGAAEQQAFIEQIAPAAQASQRAMRVPASVTIAQAILESDWGRSRLAREGKNLFGIKASSGPGSAGTITFQTWEHYNGRDVIVSAAFRAYASIEDSMRDHGQFFHRNPRYHRALAVADDARAFARGIHAAGYATDPAYSNKLIQLMDRFDLYRFD